MDEINELTKAKFSVIKLQAQAKAFEMVSKHGLADAILNALNNYAVIYTKTCGLSNLTDEDQSDLELFALAVIMELTEYERVA